MTELCFMCVKDTPLILFSHIPLYRPPYSDCGRLREKGSIPVARGEGYQTLLSPETSQLLLNTLRPSLIFRYFSPSPPPPPLS
jgi:ethanolamine phosphate phosphodiesterase